METITEQEAQLAIYTAKVLETAQTEAFDLRYLLPGIAGEIGEMFGHRAKAFWHGKSEEDLNAELKLEMGDVCWMTALLLNRLEAYDIPVTLGSDSWAEAPNVVLMDMAGDLVRWKALEDLGLGPTYPQLLGLALSLWVLMEDNSVRLTGHPFQDVLDDNVAKLADRAARGKLKGSGDHR